MSHPLHGEKKYPALILFGTLPTSRLFWKQFNSVVWGILCGVTIKCVVVLWWGMQVLELVGSWVSLRCVVWGDWGMLGSSVTGGEDRREEY